MKQWSRKVEMVGQGGRRRNRYGSAALILLLVLGILASLAACSGNSGDNNPPKRTSTIRGNVADVLAGLGPAGERPGQFARWKDFFTVPSAHAQVGNLGGITVETLVNGVVIDTVTTDATGNFTVRVSEGTITLRFRTATFSVSISIEVQALSTVVIVVTVSPREVVVISRIIIDEDTDDDGDIDDDDDEDTSNAIRCEKGLVRLGQEDTDLLIDGDGDACLRATGNCRMSLSFRDLILRNCEQCVRAEGNGVIDLTASRNILCNSSEDGIRAEGNADITLVADDSVIIAAPDTGIRAAGNASVEIDTPDCVIEEAERQIRTEGNATVTGCGN